MRNNYTSRWIKIHTIAKFNKKSLIAEDGIIAVVDENEKQAGIIDFSIDTECGFECCINMTKPPTPEQLFDVLDTVPLDYITKRKYYTHPEVIGFQPQINWIWKGSMGELFFAATNNTDLMFSNRKIIEADSDHFEMSGLYGEIRKYLKKKDRKSNS